MTLQLKLKSGNEKLIEVTVFEGKFFFREPDTAALIALKLADIKGELKALDKLIDCLEKIENVQFEDEDLTVMKFKEIYPKLDAGFKSDLYIGFILAKYTQSVGAEEGNGQES